MGKGVDVENYPGVVALAATGPKLVQLMQRQAHSFNTHFFDRWVSSVDVSKTGEIMLELNNSETNKLQKIRTASLIIATGADSRWLGVEGEHDLKGGGVSACATCDGFLFKGKPVVVIGGGDTAMEDALVLARTSSSVLVIHRRDSFRASHALAQRVLSHPKIKVRWNAQVEKFVGAKPQVMNVDANGQATEAAAGMGEVPSVLQAVMVKYTKTGEVEKIEAAAAFVAIGHDPNTKMFKDVLDMDEQGYLKTVANTARTSVEGVFAAGDVADKVYRQAITSAGTGAMAALDAERWLSEKGFGIAKAESAA